MMDGVVGRMLWAEAVLIRMKLVTDQCKQTFLDQMLMVRMMQLVSEMGRYESADVLSPSLYNGTTSDCVQCNGTTECR